MRTMKSRNTLIFIIIILACLVGISFFFPKEGFDIGIRKLYFPAFEDFFKGDDTQSEAAMERLQAMEEELRLQRYRDSIYTDSLTHYITFFEESTTRIFFPDDDFDFFNDLFGKMDSCNQRGEIIRILHYGASQIEGDRITGYLRQQLQEKFSGNGPGLLPIMQPIPSLSVEQSASSGIERHIVSGMHQNKASHNRYGVLGQFGAVDRGSSITVSTRRNAYEHAREFQTIRLFFGRDTDFTARLTLQGKEPEEASLTNTTSPVKVYTWNLSAPVKSFSINTTGSGELYGIAADGTAGVAIDNIPFRGSSGTFFNTLDQPVMSAMLQQLNTHLIILQFGSNVVPAISGKSSIDYYCSNLSKSIIWLRNTCPQAKIMLIGPSDMSTRVNGQLTTYPLLETLIEAMKETALQNGAAFWNMYEVMGGKNSMIEWVRHSPSLATQDYVHFTTKGVERIASLFWETLMVYYDYYRFITNKESLTCEETPSSDF